jgi:hypothetical protein
VRCERESVLHGAHGIAERWCDHIGDRGHYSATLFSSSPQTFAAIDAEIARGHQLADAIERIAFADRT